MQFSGNIGEAVIDQDTDQDTGQVADQVVGQVTARENHLNPLAEKRTAKDDNS